ncbi:MAG: hypothetical protein ABW321_11125 [Polyangiales bacterium]
MRRPERRRAAVPRRAGTLRFACVYCVGGLLCAVGALLDVLMRVSVSCDLLVARVMRVT